MNVNPPESPAKPLAWQALFSSLIILHFDTREKALPDS